MPDASQEKGGEEAEKKKITDEIAHTKMEGTDQTGGSVSKSGGLADFFTDFFSSMCSLGTKKEPERDEGEHEEDHDHSDDEIKEEEPSGMEAALISAAEEQLYGFTATDGVSGPTGKKKILYPEREGVYGCYEGPVLKGVWHGKGKLTFSNGAVYEGDFVQEIRHGKGVFHGANGEFYEGDWVRGEPVGRGKMVFQNGESYEGDILAGGVFHGSGTYEWPDGRRYEGQWDHNKFHGHGKFWFEHGDTYEGEWDHDRMHGEGIKLEDGVKYHVNYRDGFLVAYSRDGFLTHIVNEKTVLQQRKGTHDPLLGIGKLAK